MESSLLNTSLSAAMANAHTIQALVDQIIKHSKTATIENSCWGQKRVSKWPMGSANEPSPGLCVLQTAFAQYVSD